MLIRHFNGEIIIFLSNRAGAIGYHVEKMKLNPYIIPYLELTMMEKDQNVRGKTSKRKQKILMTLGLAKFP